MGPQELLSLPRQDAAGFSSAPGVVVGAGRFSIPRAGVEQLGWEGRRPPRPTDSADHDLANLGQDENSVTLSRSLPVLSHQPAGLWCH